MLIYDIYIFGSSVSKSYPDGLAKSYAILLLYLLESIVCRDYSVYCVFWKQLTSIALIPQLSVQIAFHLVKTTLTIFLNNRFSDVLYPKDTARLWVHEHGFGWVWVKKTGPMCPCLASLIEYKCQAYSIYKLQVLATLPSYILIHIV